ncbi:putative Major facilitator superfamily (MFS) profile domain-containing protein [Seiridium unicorne]|uniref:Major facilitator superfamily (MFS) profile domain-containing protein n=1 Tax=Seiridium unicorne TaxID=138068 RepID=A0ABR2VI57_9PEZI
METGSARVAHHNRAVNHLTHGVTRCLHYCHIAERAHSGAILQAIIADLRGDMTQGFWTEKSYLLSNAVIMSFHAAISEIFGQLFCLIVYLLLFTTGTLLYCLSREILLMLVGRSLHGVGGGAGGGTILVIFTDIVPLRFRPKWYGTVYRKSCLSPAAALIEC